MKKITVFFLLIPLIALSQNETLRVGEWKHHFSFRDCFAIIETNDAKIIGAAKMGLVVYGKNDLSITTITKFNGLSDYDLSALAYSPQTNTVFVGYENGSIDILANGTVTNINALKLKQMSGDKRIRHILPDNATPNTIYCCTGFGILTVDTKQREIRTTWYIGNEAADLAVNQLLKHNNHLFAATAQGVRRISTSAEPSDYKNWETISSPEPYCALQWFNGSLTAAKGSAGGTCQIQQLVNGLFTTKSTVNRFSNLYLMPNTTAGNEKLAVAAAASIQIYGHNFALQENINKNFRIRTSEGETAFTPTFKDVLISADGLWIADETEGVLRHEMDGLFSQFLPQGPFSNECWKLCFAGENLWAVRGGKSPEGYPAEKAAIVSILTPNGWQLYSERNIPQLKGHRDFIGITPNTNNPNNVFINSWGGGVFEFDVNEKNQWYLKNHFGDSNNGLQSIPGLSGYYVKIGGMAFDKESSQIYMANMELDDFGMVGYFPADKSFIRYTYETIRGKGLHTATSMLIHSGGNRWLIIERAAKPTKGLFVWNDNGTPKNQTDDVYKGAIHPSQENDRRNAGQIRIVDTENNLIGDAIFSIAEDKNGYVWIGTNNGIAVQHEASRIMEIENPVFTRIKVPHGDGTNDAGYLLENDRVTVIAVDGGDRKWLGTELNGLYLVSPDGTNTVSHFDTSNSNLPSNEIKTVEINHKTGEVFVGTPKGLVSFRGTSTQGENDFKNAYVFPNPVRPSYDGTITIAGLMEKSNLKITDTSGKLVFETTSVGGQAQWDGRNLWGEKVKTGVYLIYVAAESSEVGQIKSEVLKLAIVR